jgi:serine/threonine-protein kinase
VHPEDDRPPEASEPVGAEDARRQVSRILASPHFAKAARLRHFLDFATGEALKVPAAGIKEAVIGIEVFGRDVATYDPRIDPIVRVQAGRIRAKLDDYYAGEGASDPVLVALPRGQYVPRFSFRSGDGDRRPSTSGPAALADAVAVLPFVNLSADPADEYFGDGLTEELTHALARLPSVRVTARRSAFRFREHDRDIREIGRLLGAGRIVEGSVRKVGDRIRVTAQLVDVADGIQLWSGRYDRTMNDVLALQEEIADAIRRALSARLGEAVASSRGASTANADALHHYLLGRFHWNKRNEAGLRNGIAHFNEAIAADPSCARAWSGLADCHVMLAQSGVDRPDVAMPLARQAALRALEIDANLVEAHTSLAIVRLNYEWDRNGAELAFQRGFESDPGYATLHHWYGLYALTSEQRFDEAADEVEWAERLDPISLPIHLGHAQLLILAGDCEGAIAQCGKVLGLDARYYRAWWFLGMAHDCLGNCDAACEALETALARGGDERAFRARILGALGHACGHAGSSDRATAIRAELAAMAGSTWVDPFELAQVHAGLGDTDAALTELERAAEARSGYLVFAALWPAFAFLRSHPRFRAILDRMAFHPAR